MQHRRQVGIKSQLVPQQLVVDRVDARGFDFDEDLALTGLRCVDLSELETSVGTVLLRDVCFQDADPYACT